MTRYLLVSFLLCTGTATAQFRSAYDGSASVTAAIHAGSPLVREYAFVSGLALDNRNTVNLSSGWSPEATTEVSGKKSPYLAAGLSLILPGLGEYYVGDQIWRGMIFTGLEVGLWLERDHYLSREADSMHAFYAYSDTHWSRARFIQSMDSIIVKDTALHVLLDGDPNDINSINRREEILDSLSLYWNNPTIKNWSHRLRPIGSQQYYELISKYLQYIPGWEQPEQWNVASEMRANMNHQDEIATYFLWGILANHILSAIDAAILASDHNATLHLHGDLLRRPYPGGGLGYVPTARLQFTF